MSARNNNLPLHRLPPELLMVVLYDARRRVADIRLTHVCHYWRTLLLAMPEFWASMLNQLKISIYHVHYGLLKHCLTLSSPRPIKVHGGFQGDVERALLAPHASRIVQLSIHSVAAGGGRALDELLDGGMSSLTTLVYHHTNFRQLFRPLSEYPLPALRHLEIPASFPLHMWVVPTLQEILFEGQPNDIDRFREALRCCPSLRSLSFKPDDLGRSGLPFSGNTLDEPPSKDETLSLHKVSITGPASAMVHTLMELNIPPSVQVQLRCDDQHVGIAAVLSVPTVLADILPSLTHLYLGRTHAKGRVRLHGYTSHHDGNRFEERLGIAMWRDKKAENALTDLLRPFIDTPVTALAVDLPHLPLALERSAWGQRWAGAGANAFSPPRALRRLELLGGTSTSAKVRFARWFVGGPNDDRPPSDALTLCWVLDVSRGQDCEDRAYQELAKLGQLLEEFSGTQRRLGRLELYGTMQSGIVVTRAGKLSTNVGRCREVAGSFIARFEAMVDTVVIR